MEVAVQDASPSRAARRRVESGAVRMLAGLVLGSTLGVIIASVRLDPVALAPLKWSAAPWALMVVAASMATISFGEGRPALSMDLPILLACAFSIGPVPAGIVALVAAWDPMEIRRQIPLSRALFNHAQTALAVMGAGFVFEALRGDVSQWPRVIPIAFAALLADSVINIGLVGLITALSERSKIVNVIRSSVKGRTESFVAMYAAFGFTGLLVAVMYASGGVLGLFAFALPLLLAREAFLRRSQVQAADRAAESHRSALSRVDERIAVERRDERLRVAEALHHDVLQSLYTLSLRSHLIKEAYRTGRLLDLEADVPELVSSCSSAVGELLDFIGGLQRSSVGSTGLVSTLELYVSHLHAQYGLNIVADLEADVSAEPSLELVVYRIAQEALLNAARHSRADTVWLQLRRDHDALSLSVIDNGVGFMDDGRTAGGAFGLVLMRDRARSVGGRMEIRSRPGSGTTIESRFPVRAGYPASR